LIVRCEQNKPQPYRRTLGFEDRWPFPHGKSALLPPARAGRLLKICRVLSFSAVSRVSYWTGDFEAIDGMLLDVLAAIAD
jgi:hypothetical protein